MPHVFVTIITHIRVQLYDAGRHETPQEANSNISMDGNECTDYLCSGCLWHISSCCARLLLAFARKQSGDHLKISTPSLVRFHACNYLNSKTCTRARSVSIPISSYIFVTVFVSGCGHKYYLTDFDRWDCLIQEFPVANCKNDITRRLTCRKGYYNCSSIRRSGVRWSLFCSRSYFGVLLLVSSTWNVYI